MTPGVLIPCAAHVPPRCRGKTKNVCESHAGFRAGKTHCIRNPKPKLLPEQPKTLPKWSQNRPQMDPEGLLETILEPCSKKTWFWRLPSGLWSSKMIQNCDKIEKKTQKNEYQKHSISRHVFFQIFSDFGAIFGVNSRTLESSKMSIWCSQNTDFHVLGVPKSTSKKNMSKSAKK